MIAKLSDILSVNRESRYVWLECYTDCFKQEFIHQCAIVQTDRDRLGGCEILLPPKQDIPTAVRFNLNSDILSLGGTSNHEFCQLASLHRWMRRDFLAQVKFIAVQYSHLYCMFEENVRRRNREQGNEDHAEHHEEDEEDYEEDYEVDYYDNCPQYPKDKDEEYFLEAFENLEEIFIGGKDQNVVLRSLELYMQTNFGRLTQRNPLWKVPKWRLVQNLNSLNDTSRV